MDSHCQEIVGCTDSRVSQESAGTSSLCASGAVVMLLLNTNEGDVPTYRSVPSRSFRSTVPQVSARAFLQYLFSSRARKSIQAPEPQTVNNHVGMDEGKPI